MTPAWLFLWQRIGSARLLLASVMVSTLLAACVVAALTSFTARALPEAVGADLASAPDTTIAISGQLGAVQVRHDQRAVRSAIGHALRLPPRPVNLRTYQAVWSDPIGPPGQARTTTVIQAAALSGIAGHAALTAGSWPAASGGTAIQAAAPASVAAQLHLRVGQVLVLSDRVNGAPVRLVLTGLYRVRDPADPYWRLDLIGTSGVSVLPGFATYGPLAVAPGAFGPGGLAVGGASWLVVPEVRQVRAAQLTALAVRLRAAVSHLASSARLGGLQVSTGLPAALTGVAARLAVARSLLAVSELELLLLAVAALALAAAALAGQRELELAMLSARGSGRWQLARLTLAEAAMVTAAAAVAGALAGRLLAGWLTSAGSLGSAHLAAGGVAAGAGWQAIGMAVVVAAVIAALCSAAMTWPALRPFAPGAASGRRGRRAAVAATARAGGDIALVALAALAAWQLHAYSVLGARSGHGVVPTGVDPVLALAPAVALAAATVLPLRLLPVLAKAADRLAVRASRLTVAMTSWQIGRRAVRQSAPMLLVVLAVGAGTLALAQHQSWLRSAADQAAFAAGANVRADLAVPSTLARSAAIGGGRRAAMAVSSGLAASTAAQILAVDARHAPPTVLLRPDQSALPLPALWHRLLPSGRPAGIALPGRPARLKLTMRLTAGHGAGSGAHVILTVQDATGAAYAVSAGVLPGDGQARALTSVLAAPGDAIYPLRLLAISVAVPKGSIGVSALATSAASSGPFGQPLAAGRAIGSWAPVRSAGHLVLAAPGPAAPVPGIATRAFLKASHASVGQLVQLSAPQASVAVRIVAVVTSFPTVSGQAGGLVVDQAAVAAAIAGQGAPPLPVTQWWLAGPRPPAAAGIQVVSRARLLAAQESDPLAEIPQLAVLLLAIAAAALAVVGFGIAIAAAIGERRPQSALLAALGVDPGAQARQLCLESFAVAGPAAATGLALGVILAHLLVPAVTVTVTATTPVPPALVVVPVLPCLLLALAVTVVPVLVAAASVLVRRDPAAQLRVAEAL